MWLLLLAACCCCRLGPNRLHLGLRRQPGWPRRLLGWPRRLLVLRSWAPGAEPPCACGGRSTRGRSILHRTSHIGSTTHLAGVGRCRARSRNAGSGSRPQVHMAACQRRRAHGTRCISTRALAPRMRAATTDAQAEVEVGRRSLGPVGTQRSGHCMCSEQWQAEASREGRHGGNKIASGAFKNCWFKN